MEELVAMFPDVWQLNLENEIRERLKESVSRAAECKLQKIYLKRLNDDSRS